MRRFSKTLEKFGRKYLPDESNTDIQEETSDENEDSHKNHSGNAKRSSLKSSSKDGGNTSTAIDERSTSQLYLAIEEILDDPKVVLKDSTISELIATTRELMDLDWSPRPKKFSKSDGAPSVEMCSCDNSNAELEFMEKHFGELEFKENHCGELEFREKHFGSDTSEDDFLESNELLHQGKINIVARSSSDIEKNIEGVLEPLEDVVDKRDLEESLILKGIRRYLRCFACIYCANNLYHT